MKLKNLWKNRWILRSLLYTIYFNFHYLPFRQAIHLPILLYKPHFIALKGRVKIIGKVRFGMIKMGCYGVYIYPNNGIYWENRGGTVVFNGNAYFGNCTFLSIGKKAEVNFGNCFSSTTSLKLVSVRKINIGEHVSFGWECLIMDTNFHPLIDLSTKKVRKASGTIEIGDYNWFGAKCIILHSASTPPRCIFSLGSIVTRKSEKESYCVMGYPDSMQIIARNLYRDIGGENDFERF